MSFETVLFYLRNNGYLRSKVMQTNMTNVDVINNDLTVGRFNNTE